MQIKNNTKFALIDPDSKIEIKGITVDLDETLSWTIGHWITEMQKLFGNPEKLSVEEMAKKYTYTQHVPYWQTEEAKAWMESQRFSNDIQRKLPLVAGAREYLHKIAKIVPIAAYLSIRPIQVYDGTKDWLEMHGFPEAPIILRPEHINGKDGGLWKGKMLQKLWPGVIGIIDDNPSILEGLPQSYKGTVFLFNSEKNPAPERDCVVPCKDWKETYRQISAEKGRRS